MSTFREDSIHVIRELRAERKINDLKAENDKLRELVRNVEHYERFGCRGCPYADSCDAGTLYDEYCAMSREIEREMRELEIEVDA